VVLTRALWAIPKEPEMTLMIREAVPEDLPQVHEMIGLLARHHEDEPKISVETLHRQVFEIGLGRIWVAAEEEGLVGYALVLTRPNLVTGGVGHDINHLFVMEWRRKAGIGRALIAAARQAAQAEGAEVLMIGTHWKNLGAQKAYRDMGLEEVTHGPRFRIALA
jgi:GNAT superfamily N-acetyltransferase